MNIYKAESHIADKIKNNRILCYSKVESANNTDPKQIVLHDKNRLENFDFTKADINDSDLYFHQSILVTTNWNKNDDLFLPDQVWAARQTPNHKPTNLNHDSTKIVGHIVANYGLTEDNQIIPDDTAVEDLPNRFHILTSSVIYKLYHSDSEYQETVEELISDIDSGNIFVSMECVFPDFSYALDDGSGNLKIIARNERTAFLSQYLKYYGGKGEYNHNRIARVPRNIRFIGKGYTKNPANEESIVFSRDKLFSLNSISYSEKIEEFSESGVILSSKQNTNGDLLMSENTKQFDELKSLNEKLQGQIDDLKAELAKADIQKYEDKLATADEDKKVLSAKLTSAEEDKVSLNEQIEELNKSASEKDEQIKSLNEEKESLAKQIDELNKEQAKADRIKKLEDAGFDAEAAKSKFEIFANLNDEQFDIVLSEIHPMKKAEKKKKEEEMSKSDEVSEDADVEGEANAEEVDVDTLEAEKTSTADVDNENDETEDNTFSIASLMSEKFNVENK